MNKELDIKDFNIKSQLIVPVLDIDNLKKEGEKIKWEKSQFRISGGLGSKRSTKETVASSQGQQFSSRYSQNQHLLRQQQQFQQNLSGFQRQHQNYLEDYKSLKTQQRRIQSQGGLNLQQKFPQSVSQVSVQNNYFQQLQQENLSDLLSPVEKKLKEFQDFQESGGKYFQSDRQFQQKYQGKSEFQGDQKNQRQQVQDQSKKRALENLRERVLKENSLINKGDECRFLVEKSSERVVKLMEAINVRGGEQKEATECFQGGGDRENDLFMLYELMNDLDKNYMGELLKGVFKADWLVEITGVVQVCLDLVLRKIKDSELRMILGYLYNFWVVFNEVGFKELSANFMKHLEEKCSLKDKKIEFLEKRINQQQTEISDLEFEMMEQAKQFQLNEGKLRQEVIQLNYEIHELKCSVIESQQLENSTKSLKFINKNVEQLQQEIFLFEKNHKSLEFTLNSHVASMGDALVSQTQDSPLEFDLASKKFGLERATDNTMKYVIGEHPFSVFLVLKKTAKKDFEVWETEQIEQILLDFENYLVELFNSENEINIFLRELFIIFLQKRFDKDSYMVGQALNNILNYLQKIKQISVQKNNQNQNQQSYKEQFLLQKYCQIFGCLGTETVSLKNQTLYLELFKDLLKIQEAQEKAKQQEQTQQQNPIKILVQTQNSQGVNQNQNQEQNIFLISKKNSLDQIFNLAVNDSNELREIIKNTCENVDTSVLAYVKIKYKQAKSDDLNQQIPIYSILNSFLKSVLKFEEDSLRNHFNRYIKETNSNNRINFKKLKETFTNIGILNFNFILTENNIFTYSVARYLDHFRSSKRRQKSEINASSNFDNNVSDEQIKDLVYNIFKSIYKFSILNSNTNNSDLSCSISQFNTPPQTENLSTQRFISENIQEGETHKKKKEKKKKN